MSCNISEITNTHIYTNHIHVLLIFRNSLEVFFTPYLALRQTAVIVLISFIRNLIS